MNLSGLKRIRKLRVAAVLLVLFFSLYLTFSGHARRRIHVILSSDCISYKQPVFSNKLKDRIVDYSDEARTTAIEPCSNEKEIKKMVRSGKLARVSEGRSFDIDGLVYSYAVLTPQAKDLLFEIARRFREKTEEKGLDGSKFLVTSMTRTTEQMKVLRKNNSNASANSPHMGGNAFDISYLRFRSRKLYITECDKSFFKEALAEVILELRKENRCWATYEKNQSCFHVVAK